jgi:hypothetical protein
MSSVHAYHRASIHVTGEQYYDKADYRSLEFWIISRREAGQALPDSVGKWWHDVRASQS